MKGAETKIVIVGAGLLGGNVLQQLVARNPNAKFWLIARDAEQVQLQVNLTKYIDVQWGGGGTIYAEKCDVLDTKKFAALLKRIEPDILFNATTPFAWWKINNLPLQYSTLCDSVGPGIWGAIDALLPLSLIHISEPTRPY